MKKLIILALLAVIMAGCSLANKDISKLYDTCIIDSCEYVFIEGFSYPTHKGNCKYCDKRDSIKWKKRKAELKELVEQIKER